MLYTDTNFLPKLRKCRHEEMVCNCYNSRVALHLQVKAKEVMNCFMIFADHHHFGLHHTISGNRYPEKWCYVVSIFCWFLFYVYSSVEPKFCNRYSLFVKCIGTLSNQFTRFEQPTAALV